MDLLWSTGYRVAKDGTRTMVRRALDLDDPALHSITNEGGWSGGWRIQCADASAIVDDWRETVVRDGRIRQANAPESDRFYALAPTVGRRQLAEDQERRAKAERLASIAKYRKSLEAERRAHPHSWKVDYSVKSNSHDGFAIMCGCGARGWFVKTGHEDLSVIAGLRY